MKKVLLISYYFPPCNMTPALRTNSWAKYFKQLGYYPVVITRNWDIPVKNQSDIDKATGTEVRYEKNDLYEIYYLPFKGNLRTRVYQKVAGTRFAFISKLFTVVELLVQNLSARVIPFHNFFRFTEQYVKEHKDIEALVISANPFILFKLGYDIKKKYHVKWVADYRDDWSTYEIKLKNNFWFNLKYKYDAYFERKWVRSANLVTTVSGHYVKKLEHFLGRKCELVENGYYEELYRIGSQDTFEEFTIVYNGTLYNEQPVELFIEAFKKIVDEFKSQVRIKLLFLGVAFDKHQSQRLFHLLDGYQSHYEITERMDNQKVIAIQMRAHVLLMIAYGGLKGIPGSKLYEYIGCRKPVILCPSDRDIIEETLTGTRQALICNSSEQAYLTLKELVQGYLENHSIAIDVDTEKAKQYTRFNQARVLVDLMNKMN